jgi:3-oxoacyl-[acyl-carrier protein] reductase
MADRYARLVGSPLGGVLARPLRLPRPVTLQRHVPGAPVIDGTVLLGAAPGGRLTLAAAQTLAGAGVQSAITPGRLPAGACASAGLQATVFDPENPGSARFKGLVFDASRIAESNDLVQLQAFFHPTVARLQQSGRVIVLAIPPEETVGRARSAQRALEGFTRSLGKELGSRGATVNLIHVSPGAEEQLPGTLRFLLSPRSAYISGQVVRIGPGAPPDADLDWDRPLHRRLALVTGAARGIGASIARTLAREGARVVGLDVPAAQEELQRVMSAIEGEPLAMDITQPEAPQLLAKRFGEGLDILVHNAGVTRDRTIAKMGAERWRELMEINLSSQERINDVLIERHLLGEGARVVCVSSMSGIAGNAGQTNYATSKAGVIGTVEALAPSLAERGASINAVAPGFIETDMTAAMPIAIREAGRRMNSLRQGGLPVDVAEAVAWLAGPAAGGVNGNVIRVCGQSLIGA